jgi:outer membrane immunogenic protein
MKKLLLAAGAFGFLIGNCALAADLGVPLYKGPAAIYSWTGCYLGGNVGGASARQNANESTVAMEFFVNPGSVTANNSGVIGGVHAGCNVEGTYGVARGWVFGIEADGSWPSLKGTQTVAPPGSGSITFTENTKYLVSIRGRAGVTVVPNVLVYATMGVAWNHTDYAGLHSFTACPNCSAAAFTAINFGWVSGGGIEWALWNSNWIVRAEGLYYIFDGSNTNGYQFGAVNTNWFWNNLGIAEGRVGLSYKFGYGP